MGLRGPAPTPSSLLKSRGSWRGKKNKGEPVPGDGLPACPEWLSPEAKVVWRQVIGILSAMKVVTTADANTLARYADAFARWRKAAEFLAEKGEVYTMKNKAGEVVNVVPWPQVAIYSKLADYLTKIEDRFGLSPSARTRITVVEAEEKSASQKARFFGGPKLAAG